MSVSRAAPRPKFDFGKLVSGPASGGVLTVVVHITVILAALIWRNDPRPPEVHSVIFVQTEPLVRKGRKATPEEKKMLPRLTSPEPPDSERVHLGQKKKKEEEERKRKEREKKRKAEEEKKRKRREERERKKRMRDALRRFKTPDELPIGREDGSEMGTAEVGRLKASYVDRVTDELQKEWRYSFIPADELRRLRGKIKLTVDRNGVIKRHSWMRRSGNADFDQSVETCLRHFTRKGAKRLPPFPDERAFGASLTMAVIFDPTK